MYLEAIIEDVQFESDKFKAKGVLNRDDVVGWLKSIAGFVNASGGELKVGLNVGNISVKIEDNILVD